MAETILAFRVADPEICDAINLLADAALDAGIEIATQMRDPTDTQEVIEFGGASHALQAVLMQARRRGISDQAMFAALATAIGAFAKRQQLGHIDCVCAQLAHRGANAARAVTEEEALAVPTMGNA